MESVQARVGMPLAEFLEAFHQQPFELINGERIIKMSNMFFHSELIRLLFVALYTYTVAEQAGEVFSETTFILPGHYDSSWVEGSRIPDLMYYSGDRIKQYKQENPDHRFMPLALVPDLVVEVVSPNDKVSELDAKIDAYLADGVRFVWVIDPQRRKVHLHEPDNEMVIQLSGDAVLDGGEVLPGFQMALPKLFA